jgi:hypothetical protein
MQYKDNHLVKDYSDSLRDAHESSQLFDTSKLFSDVEDDHAKV